MTLDPPHVAICVCTAGRTSGLIRLLDHLGDQRWIRAHPGWASVVVVDNNPGADARVPVERWSAISELAVVYRHVPVPSISRARNEALRAAAEVATLAALIDDDEQPEPDWIDELVATHRATGAPIVIGRVVATLPDDAPRWIVDGGFHDLGTWPDGAELSEGLSGNALLHLPTVAAHGLRFDEGFGLSGGEDQVFFRQAHAAGLSLRYAARATVSEVVPAERLAVGFLARRAYRKGNTLGLIARRYPELGESPVFRAAAASKWAAVGALTLLFGGLRLDRARAVRGLLGWCFAAGMVGGLAGRRYDQYRPSAIGATGGSEAGSATLPPVCSLTVERRSQRHVR